MQGAVAPVLREGFTASGRRARLLEPAWLPAASPDSRERHGLFWGVDGRGRRHPLRLSPDNSAFDFGLPSAACAEAVIEPCATGHLSGLFVST
ncbi:MAG: hypothetical protein ACLSHC_09935 [Bilophila wadsworthia]